LLFFTGKERTNITAPLDILEANPTLLHYIESLIYSIYTYAFLFFLFLFFTKKQQQQQPQQQQPNKQNTTTSIQAHTAALYRKFDI